MKKTLLTLVLLITSFLSFGQTEEIGGRLKIGDTPEVTQIDSILIIGNDKIVSKVKFTEFYAKVLASLGEHTIDTDTKLTEAEVDAFVADNGYYTSSNFDASQIAFKNKKNLFTFDQEINKTSPYLNFQGDSYYGGLTFKSNRTGTNVQAGSIFMYGDHMYYDSRDVTRFRNGSPTSNSFDIYDSTDPFRARVYGKLKVDEGLTVGQTTFMGNGSDFAIYTPRFLNLTAGTAINVLSDLALGSNNVGFNLGNRSIDFNSTGTGQFKVSTAADALINTNLVVGDGATGNKFIKDGNTATIIKKNAFTYGSINTVEKPSEFVKWGNQTGAIYFKVPKAGNYGVTSMKLRYRNYTEKYTTIELYNYSSGNKNARVYNDASNYFTQIRMANDATHLYFIFRDIADVWAYPRLELLEVNSTISQFILQDWESGVLTDLSGLGNISPYIVSNDFDANLVGTWNNKTSTDFDNKYDASSFGKTQIEALGLNYNSLANKPTIPTDTNTQLSEAQVDAFVGNNGYYTSSNFDASQIAFKNKKNLFTFDQEINKTSPYLNFQGDSYYGGLTFKSNRTGTNVQAGSIFMYGDHMYYDSRDVTRFRNGSPTSNSFDIYDSTDPFRARVYGKLKIDEGLTVGQTTFMGNGSDFAIYTPRFLNLTAGTAINVLSDLALGSNNVGFNLGNRSIDFNSTGTGRFKVSTAADALINTNLVVSDGATGNKFIKDGNTATIIKKNAFTYGSINTVEKPSEFVKWGNQTGAIYFKVPKAGNYGVTSMKLRYRNYTGKYTTIELYNYSSGNKKARVYNDASNYFTQIRMANDATHLYFIFRDIADVWAYPRLELLEVNSTISQFILQDWESGVLTDLSGLGNISPYIVSNDFDANLVGTWNNKTSTDFDNKYDASSFGKTQIEALGLNYNSLANKPTIPTDTNTQLSEAQVDAFVGNNGYSTGAHTVDTKLTKSEIEAFGVNYNSLTNKPTIPTDTKLTEAEVDAFVGNNGYTQANGRVLFTPTVTYGDGVGSISYSSALACVTKVGDMVLYYVRLNDLSTNGTANLEIYGTPQGYSSTYESVLNSRVRKSGVADANALTVASGSVISVTVNTTNLTQLIITGSYLYDYISQQ